MSSARSRDGGPPNDPRTNFEAFKDAALWIVGGLLLIQLFIYVDPRVYREVGDDGSCEVSPPLHFFSIPRGGRATLTIAFTPIHLPMPVHVHNVINVLFQIWCSVVIRPKGTPLRWKCCGVICADQCSMHLDLRAVLEALSVPHNRVLSSKKNGRIFLSRFSLPLSRVLQSADGSNCRVNTPPASFLSPCYALEECLRSFFFRTISLTFDLSS